MFTIVYYASWFELLNKNALWVSLALFGACFASISMGTWLLEARHNEPRSSVLFRVFQRTFFNFVSFLIVAFGSDSCGDILFVFRSAVFCWVPAGAARKNRQ